MKLSKSLLIVIGLSATVTCAVAQSGSITLFNSAVTTFHTNTIALGGASGNALTPGGVLYYELLTAPSTVTTIDGSLQNLFSSTWSDTGISATNGGLPGRMHGAQITAALNWNQGVQQAFIIVGWSANEGTSWSQVSSELLGAALVPQNGSYYWTGGGLTPGGVIGATIVGSAIAAPNGNPGTQLFGPNPGQVQSTTELYVSVPEPGAVALAGLGAAALLIRKKRKGS